MVSGECENLANYKVREIQNNLRYLSDTLAHDDENDVNDTYALVQRQMNELYEIVIACFNRTETHKLNRYG
jgi:hypothetical protein